MQKGFKLSIDKTGKDQGKAAYANAYKVNQNQGKLDYYTQNPDQKKDASQRNVIAEKQSQKQSQGDDDKQEKKRSRKVA